MAPETTADDAEPEAAQQSRTILTKYAIDARMDASGYANSTIRNEFVTVEQLISAVESDQLLESIDGIGPKTAETIRDWYENREERERSVRQTSVERTGAKTLRIQNNGNWSDALDIEAEVFRQ